MGNTLSQSPQRYLEFVFLVQTTVKKINILKRSHIQQKEIQQILTFESLKPYTCRIGFKLVKIEKRRWCDLW